MEKGEKTGPLMVRVKDPAQAEMVRDQLNAGAKGAPFRLRRQAAGTPR